MELDQSGTGGVDQAPPGKEFHGGWVFPALLAAVLLAAAVMALNDRPVTSTDIAPEAGSPSAPPQGNTVALEIDFGNGAVRQFSALPWREGMTVADLMQEARQFRPGIQFTQVGEGAGGMLISIDLVKSEGISGRNWLFRVDGQFAEESFCLARLEPGLRVLWVFVELE